MDTPQQQSSAHWDRARAAIRAMGAKAGVGPGDSAGLPLMVAALVRTAEPASVREVLRTAGVTDVDGFLAALPAIDDDMGMELPELKADKKLASCINGELAGLVSGQVGPSDALKVILRPEAVDAEVRKLLSDPTSVFPRKGGDAIQSTEELLRGLAGYYQPRFHAGHMRFIVDPSRGYSEFLKNSKKKQHELLLEQLRQDQIEANKTVFASKLYELSPLGEYRNRYGEIDAHLVAATLLGEMMLVGNGPLSVSSLAWSLDPVRYHRCAGLVLNRVENLCAERVLETHPKDTRLHSTVLVTPACMVNWLAYLRDADPLTADDIQLAGDGLL